LLTSVHLLGEKQRDGIQQHEQRLSAMATGKKSRSGTRM
jgi:hypothetical protein